MRQISSDRCSRPIRPGLGIAFAESSSFLAWVLTRRDKPNLRGDDPDSHTDDGVEGPKDGLSPTALRAEFGETIATAVAIPAVIESRIRSE